MPNNLPVDVVRHMGADRVLGVNVPPSLSMLEIEVPGQGVFTGDGNPQIIDAGREVARDRPSDLEALAREPVPPAWRRRFRARANRFRRAWAALREQPNLLYTDATTGMVGTR